MIGICAQMATFDDLVGSLKDLANHYRTYDFELSARDQYALTTCSVRTMC